MPPHHLAAEDALRRLTELVLARERNFKNTVPAHLPHAQHLRAADQLAQQHAEHRRLLWLRLYGFRQMHTRPVG